MIVYAAVQRINFFSLSITLYCLPLMLVNKVDHSERELSLQRHRIHAVRNRPTIDSCIHSATDRRGYVLEHRFTKFSEITQ